MGGAEVKSKITPTLPSPSKGRDKERALSLRFFTSACTKNFQRRREGHEGGW
jgi:hypothetical protein